MDGLMDEEMMQGRGGDYSDKKVKAGSSKWRRYREHRTCGSANTK